MLKRGLLVLFFIIIAIALYYTLIPRPTQRLIYFPSSDNPFFEEYLLAQESPLNSFDMVWFTLFPSKEGWIRVDGYLSKIDMIDLAKSNKSEKTRVMVAYGGERVDEFFTQIARQANLDKAKLEEIFKQKAKFLEASILAKRYKIPYRIDEASVLNYILADTLVTYKKIAQKEGIKSDSKEFFKKLIVASIIQKETAYSKEMPLVASVIYNRLQKDIKLQMDATLNYGKNAHTIITPKLIKEDTSSFNTYKHKGLPPEPLAIFSLSALKAAFHPTKTNYLYFVKRGNKHSFSSKYLKHKSKVALYKKRLFVHRFLKKEFRRVAYYTAHKLKPSIFTLYLPIK